MTRLKRFSRAKTNIVVIKRGKGFNQGNVNQSILCLTMYEINIILDSYNDHIQKNKYVQ